MRLFAFELKKLILNRRTLMLLAALFAIYGAIGYSTTYFLLGDKASYTEYARLAEPLSGHLEQSAPATPNLSGIMSALQGMDTEAILGELPTDLNSAQAGRGRGRGHGAFSFGAEFRLQAAYTQYTMNINNFRRQVSNLESQVASLEQGLDSSALAQAQSDLDRLNKLGEPPFANTAFWDNLLGNVGSGVVIFLLFVPLAYIIAPIFAQETSTGMDSLILSSKFGRGRLVGVKLGAMAVAVFTLVFLYFFSTWLFGWLASGTMAGWNAPVRSVLMFFNAPFNMSVWQFFLLSFLWLFMIGAAYACLLSLISSSMKSAMGSFGIGLIILFLNFVLLALGANITDKIQPLIDLGLTNVTSILTVFTSAQPWQIFGLSLPYWLVVVLVWTLIALLSILGVYRIQKRKSVA